ncbi:MAG: Pr6Pr family membrane protein [Pseudomonadota bacterium]
MRLVRLIAILAAVVLALRYGVNVARGDGVFDEAWQMAKFFTILTNFGILVVFTRAAWAGRLVGPNAAGALTLFIAVVALVYHGFLYQGFSPVTIDFWIDHGLHTAIPALMIVYWFTLSDARTIGVREATLWMVWPLSYLFYVLVRGSIEGSYPYFFLDIDRFGIGRITINALLLTVLFFGLGLGLIWLNRLWRRRQPPAQEV